MARRETGKDRATRIPLDYYKRPDRLARGKVVLTAVAMILAAGWWASGLTWDGRSWPAQGRIANLRASHGPLARSHATWESRCDACHVPFRPIDGVARPSGRVDASHAADRACASCHQAGAHHAGETPSDVASCASCHRDHRGREADLTLVADADCTRCHAEIGRHALASSKLGPPPPDVSAFDIAHHPEFNVPKADPGTVKFNHAVHLAPGMNAQPGGKPLLRVADLAESDRARYAPSGAPATGPVRLDCASCHRPDATGRGHEPITYANDCRACHRLDFDPADPKLVAPHGLQPEPLREELRRLYGAVLLSEHPERLEKPVRPHPLPGKDSMPGDDTARKALEAKVASATRVLFGGKRCGECHEVIGDRIAAPAIPSDWMPAARFDHRAHGAVSCASCHSGSSTSKSSSDVSLPTMATCVSCHAPAGGTASAPTGGAGTSCVECHGYHARPARGALAGTPEGRAVADFVAGRPGRKP